MVPLRNRTHLVSTVVPVSTTHGTLTGPQQNYISFSTSTYVSTDRHYFFTTTASDYLITAVHYDARKVSLSIIILTIVIVSVVGGGGWGSEWRQLDEDWVAVGLTQQTIRCGQLEDRT